MYPISDLLRRKSLQTDANTIHENKCEREYTRRQYRRINRILNHFNNSASYSHLDPGEKYDMATDPEYCDGKFFYDEDSFHEHDSESIPGSPKTNDADPDFQFNCPYTVATDDNKYE